MIPIYDNGLRLTGASGAQGATLQLSQSASRWRLPSIPHMACMIIAHQSVELTSMHVRSDVSGLALAVKGPYTAGAGTAREAVVTLKGDGHVNIKFDGSEAFKCLLERIIESDAGQTSRKKPALRLPGWVSRGHASPMPVADFVAARLNRNHICGSKRRPRGPSILAACFLRALGCGRCRWRQWQASHRARGALGRGRVYLSDK